MICNIKDFFLSTPIIQPEYMNIHIRFFRKILLKNIT